jgi:putative ATP-dependent endonuclease of the OLD family
MKITKVEIHNWRSVKHLEVECQALMVLLGPNNHGKSNVLAAIGYALSAGEKPAAEDFFAKREVTEGETDELWVELTFEELSEVERSTFKKYVGADGKLRVRKTATLVNGSSVDEVRYNGWLSQPKVEWLQGSYKPKKADLQAELEPHLPEGKYSQRAVEIAKEAYIAAHKDDLEFDYDLEKSPFLGVKTVAAGTLPEWFLIPAVRDLTDETKTKSTATFGRLLTRAVKEMTELDPKVREVLSCPADLTHRHPSVASR